MFGLNRNSTPNPMSNYRDAKKRFDKITPIRGTDGSERPAANRRNRSLTLREVVDSDGTKGIALRYYRTDVITFFEDDRILLEVYPSMSTNRLVNDVLAYNEIVSYWQDESIRACFTKVGPAFYLTPSFVEIKGGTKVLSGHDTIVTPRVDRKAANAAYKEYHIKDFVTWAKTLERLGQLGENLTQRTICSISPDKIAALLEQRDFAAVADATCARHYSGEHEKISTMIDRVRLAVVKSCGAIEMQERASLPDYSAIRAHISAVRKYLL